MHHNHSLLNVFAGHAFCSHDSARISMSRRFVKKIELESNEEHMLLEEALQKSVADKRAAAQTAADVGRQGGKRLEHAANKAPKRAFFDALFATTTGDGSAKTAAKKSGDTICDGSGLAAERKSGDTIGDGSTAASSHERAPYGLNGLRPARGGVRSQPASHHTCFP